MAQLRNLDAMQAEFIAYLLLEHSIVGEFINNILMIDLLQGTNAKLIASTAWNAWTASRRALVLTLPEQHVYDDGESKCTQNYVFTEDIVQVIERAGITVIES